MATEVTKSSNESYLGISKHCSRLLSDMLGFIHKPLSQCIIWNDNIEGLSLIKKQGPTGTIESVDYETEHNFKLSYRLYKAVSNLKFCDANNQLKLPDGSFGPNRQALCEYID